MVFVAVVFNAVDVVIRGAVVVDAIKVVVLVAGGRWCMLRSTAFVVVIFAGEGDVVFIAVSLDAERKDCSFTRSSTSSQNILL